MIFSKDKKPTKPGFYWALRHGRFVVVEVFKLGRGWGLYYNHTEKRGRDSSFAACRLAFGDRILYPSVETPPVDGIEAGGV